MDSRLTAVVAVVAGGTLAATGTVQYVIDGLSAGGYDPLATGGFVVATGLLLAAAGGLAFVNEMDHLALRLATGIGAVTLVLTVFSPDSLVFGGVLWLAMVCFALVGAGAYRTYTHADL